MPGDFSRDTFRPSRHFQAVYLEQGRPLVDADWNEQADLQLAALHELGEDLVGPSGASEATAGFELVPAAVVDPAGAGHYEVPQGQSPLFSPDQPFRIEVVVDSTASGPLLTLGSGPGTTSLAIGSDGQVSLSVDADRAAGTLPTGTGLRTIDARSDGRTLSIAVDGAPVAQAQLQRSGAARAARLTRVRIAGGSGASLSGGLAGVRLWTQDELAGDWVPTSGDDALKDASGSGRHAASAASGRSRKSWRDIQIRRGRYSVGGVAIINPTNVSWSQQPYLPGAAPLLGPHAQDGVSLLYVEVLSRTVDATTDPELLDPALGGVETSVRSQVIWQVKAMPGVSADHALVEKLAGRPDGRSDVTRRDIADALGRDLFLEWKRLVRGLERRMELRARRQVTTPAPVPNTMYRVQIVSPGGVLGTSAARPDEPSATVVAITDRGKLELDPPQPFGLPWQPGELVRWYSPDAPTQESPPTATISAVDRHGRLTLSNPSDGIGPVQGSVLVRVATFVWSRDNAVSAYSVLSVDKSDVGLAPSPSPQPRPLAISDWVGCETAATRAFAAIPTFHQITAISPDGATITVAPPLDVDLDAGAVILRPWDHDSSGGSAGANGPQPITPSVWATLENGIQIEMGGRGSVQTGDFWTFVTRLDTGDVAWPSDGGVPAWRAPAGVQRRLAPLAILQVMGHHVRTIDLRRLYRPLADLPADDDALGFLRVSRRIESPPGFRFANLAIDARVFRPEWGAIPPIPTEVDLGECHAAAVDGRVFVISEVGPVFMFDPATRRWSSRSAMEPAMPRRSGVAVCAVGLRIYVLGGVDDQLALLDNVDVYDTVTDTWAPTPHRLRRKLAYAAAAAIGSLIWVSGGEGYWLDVSPRRTPLATAWFLDTRTGKWHDAPELATRRARHAAVVVGSRLTVLGGLVARDPLADAELSGSVEVYDDRERRWSTPTTMPVPRQLFGAAVYEGRVYTVGGTTSQSATSTTSIWDPGTDAWSQLAGMGTSRYAFGFAALGASLVSVAGKGLEGDLVSGERMALGETLFVHEPIASEAGPHPIPPMWAETAALFDADSALARLAARGEAPSQPAPPATHAPEAPTDPVPAPEPPTDPAVAPAPAIPSPPPAPNSSTNMNENTRVLAAAGIAIMALLAALAILAALLSTGIL